MTRCPLPANQKQRQWEYDETANAPCSFHAGMELRGTLSRWMWVESDTEQTDPAWTWLNGGKKMEVASLPEPPVSMAFQWGSLSPGGRAIRLLGSGSNDDLVEYRGLVAHMVFELIIQTWPGILPQDLVVANNVFGASRWEPNFVYQFGQVSQQLPLDPPLAMPLGFWTVTPLDRCNVCPDD